MKKSISHYLPEAFKDFRTNSSLTGRELYELIFDSSIDKNSVWEQKIYSYEKHITPKIDIIEKYSEVFWFNWIWDMLNYINKKYRHAQNLPIAKINSSYEDVLSDLKSPIEATIDSILNKIEHIKKDPKIRSLEISWMKIEFYEEKDE